MVEEVAVDRERLVAIISGDGLGETAPANLYHFVGYPSLAIVPSASE